MPDSHQHDLAEIARMGPRPDIRLIAADLDGTLVDDEKRIHDEFWPLVDELHARGITFCPASGRQYYNLLALFEDVAADVVFIAENGTYVVARGAGDVVRLPAPATSRGGSVARVREIPDVGAVLCGKRSAYVERRGREVPAARAAVLRARATRARPPRGRGRRAEGRGLRLRVVGEERGAAARGVPGDAPGRDFRASTGST